MCWFHNGNTQRLTESGFMEKPGIEPATPGLQGIALIPYTTASLCPPSRIRICIVPKNWALANIYEEIIINIGCIYDQSHFEIIMSTIQNSHKDSYY